MVTMLAPGDVAPDFTATAVGGPYGTGQEVKLADFHGKTVVLYFYPKDDTPGCTAQACSLRDRFPHFEETGAAIFGVSVDSAASHLKFIEKHTLPFPLLSDDSHQIVEAYGVWVEKQMAGNKYMGTERTTFVINPLGKIKSVFRRVKPDEHTETLIQDLRHFEP